MKKIHTFLAALLLICVVGSIAPVSAAIIPSFTATPSSGPAPLTVTFGTTCSGDPIKSLLWEFGDGATSTVSPATHTYATPGNYDVTLQVRNASGFLFQTDFGTYDISVLPPPPPQPRPRVRGQMWSPPRGISPETRIRS